MPDLGSQAKDVVDANSTDTSGLLNLIEWCTAFTVQQTVIRQVRDVRNAKWGHAPQHELSDAERDDAFQAMRNLLQDPELASDSNAQEALAKITALEADEIVNFEEIEIKVLRDGIHTTNTKLDQLESQTSLEAEQIKSELQQMKDLLSQCISKIGGMKDTSDDNNIEVEQSEKLPERFSRWTHNIKEMLQTVVLSTFLIFLRVVSNRKAVSWIALLWVAQTLMVLDDGFTNLGE